MGAAYLRYSFTKGTEQEVGFLVEALGLQPGQRVLDVGCGPGTITADLAERVAPGAVVGVDRSAEVIATAVGRAGREGLRFEVGDVYDLAVDDGAFEGEGLDSPGLSGDPLNWMKR